MPVRIQFVFQLANAMAEQIESVSGFLCPTTKTRSFVLDCINKYLLQIKYQIIITVYGEIVTFSQKLSTVLTAICFLCKSTDNCDKGNDENDRIHGQGRKVVDQKIINNPEQKVDKNVDLYHTFGMKN